MASGTISSVSLESPTRSARDRLWNDLRLVAHLAREDFSKRYVGSYLGILWAFIQPTVTILILWYVFQMGFKSGPVGETPFVLWLMSGMVPFFFFSEGLASATGAIVENQYLVKRVVFKLRLLPLVKLLSALSVHLFFLAAMVSMFLLYRRWPGIYVLQLGYYVCCSICLLIGLGWITSSLMVFIKDVGQLVGMLLQLSFWFTPIFWSLDMVPEWSRGWLALNPLHYIIQGYRDSLIEQVWFWERPSMFCYFWVVCLGCLFAGAFLFRRLRPHFADTL